MTLAWDAKQPDSAVRYLVKGMKQNPMDWQLPFDAGFISYMLLDDYEAAASFFSIASKLPNTWLVTERWAAISMAKAGRYGVARQMWLDIYYGTENRKLRELAIRQLKRLKLDEGLAALQQAVDRYKESTGGYPGDFSALVRAGLIREIPEEPYGGRYFLDNGKVLSSTPPTRWE
jgi:hypothetical protein